MTTPAPVPAADPVKVNHRPDAPPLGAASPLNAAYCAERAARALHIVEMGEGPADTLTATAFAWTRLAELMALNPAMGRPRDRDEQGAR